MKKEKRNKKVIVAISGGVDSSVAAALLKRAGFQVSGVFMRLNDFSSAAEKRARKVAGILKIPLYVLDLRKEFKKRIIDYFLKEYKAGRTPNPCVICNKEIKFGLFIEKALKSGADFVATGHYARLQNNRLLKGKDKNKDQSYFLWRLNRKQLKRILFPVGNYAKTETRRMARRFKLPVFEAPESREICFIRTDIDDFLKKHLKERPGSITGEEDKSSSSPLRFARVNKEGRILGRHQGLWFYTIGQRKGIGLAGGPYYVLNKNMKNNLLIVTKNRRDLYKKELIARDVNWVSGEKQKLLLKANVKIRYRSKAVPALIYKIRDTKYKIKFKKPQRAITPGQSVVFYKGQEVLGGGIIYE
jgi:tRNA-specific 2-thiouridylase